MKNEISSVNRRSFIKRSLGGMVGLALSSGASLTRAAGRLPVREKSGEVIKRTLGKTGLKLPVVSMGVMNADNPGVVQAALDSGIVMLDTAYSYQRGRNEEMIGRIVNNRPRDSFVIVTKVPGWPWDKTTGLFNQETKGEDFLKRFDLSLRRLGLDHVDILYLHDVNKRENVLFEPILDALQTTKQSGKARFIGVSTHKNQSEVIHATIESKTYDVVLSSYNFRQD